LSWNWNGWLTIVCMATPWIKLAACGIGSGAVFVKLRRVLAARI
jgi:hypothetical protein